MLVLKIYITLLVPIIAGMVNSIFCKKNFLSFFNKPIDFNKNFIDNKRIFGDNKTFKGFIGYIIFNILFSVLLGFIYSYFNIEHLNYFYVNYSNTIFYNVIIGFLLGLFYALFELPNSFIKRRLNIVPGKTISGFKKYIFIFFDQADSVFGVALVLCFFYPIGINIYLFIVFLGAITHLLVNMLLYFMHLRKNMF